MKRKQQQQQQKQKKKKQKKNVACFEFRRVFACRCTGYKYLPAKEYRKPFSQNIGRPASYEYTHFAATPILWQLYIKSCHLLCFSVSK